MKNTENIAQTPASATSQEPIITAKGVGHFYNKLKVVDDVSLSIRTGESVAIVAPSGSGKSTLLRLILGLEMPTQGNASLLLPPHAIGAVFQEDSLLPWFNVNENLALLNTLHRKTIDEEERDRILQFFGLLDFGSYYPHQLSAGMKQKVAISRLLLYNPRLYILDESMANMDDLSRFTFCDVLHERVVEGGCSILFVTHNLTDAIHFADRVLIGSNRPLSLVKEFINPLPKQRTYKTRFTHEFQEAVEDLRVWIEQQ